MIGLTREDDQSGWKWSNGAVYNGTNLVDNDKGITNKLCVEVHYNNSKWTYKSCADVDQHAVALCQRPKFNKCTDIKVTSKCFKADSGCGKEETKIRHVDDIALQADCNSTIITRIACNDTECESKAKQGK